MELRFFFFLSNRNFENRLGHAYGKSFFRLKVCLHYACSLKFARCMPKKKTWSGSKYEFCLENYYTKCAVVVTQTIIFASFLTNQKENVLQYLTQKIIVSMEKFMLPRKMLNILVFCKTHNAQHILKKSPNLRLHMLINVMLI